MVILQAMKVEYPRCEQIPNPYLIGDPLWEPWQLGPFLTKGMDRHQQVRAGLDDQS